MYKAGEDFVKTQHTPMKITLVVVVVVVGGGGGNNDDYIDDDDDDDEHIFIVQEIKIGY
jgi:hypothetical protein